MTNKAWFTDSAALAERLDKDDKRTALQAPISAPRYCVLFLKNKIEHQTAWFYRKDHARKALALMKAKHGEKNAIIYVD